MIDFTINNKDFNLLITVQGFYSQKIPPATRVPKDIPFYMYNMSKNYKNINFMYIKDIHQIWYHGGLTGSGTIMDYVHKIKLFLNKYNFPKVYIIGSSAGGYGAILIGQILKLDKIIAIDPQTLVGHDSCLFSTDHSNYFGWQYRNLMLNKIVKNKYLDLNNLEITVPIDIYFNTGKGCYADYDAFMISRLKKNECITFIDAKCNDHGLISKEELDNIIKNF